MGAWEPWLLRRALRLRAKALGLRAKERAKALGLRAKERAKALGLRAKEAWSPQRRSVFWPRPKAECVCHWKTWALPSLTARACLYVWSALQ